MKCSFCMEAFCSAHCHFICNICYQDIPHSEIDISVGEKVREKDDDKEIVVPILPDPMSGIGGFRGVLIAEDNLIGENDRVEEVKEENMEM